MFEVHIEIYIDYRNMLFFYVLFKQIKPGFSTHEPISATFKTPPKLNLNKCLRLTESWNSRTGSVVYWVQEVTPPHSFLLCLD